MRPPPAAADLELELASKEKALGREHPDVATLLTDIAALHSEEERFATAQPLYERALKIQARRALRARACPHAPSERLREWF